MQNFSLKILTYLALFSLINAKNNPDNAWTHNAYIDTKLYTPPQEPSRFYLNTRVETKSRVMPIVEHKATANAPLSRADIKKFSKFSVEKWESRFKELGHTNLDLKNWSDSAISHIFNQVQYYQFSSYRTMLETLPNYGQQMDRLNKTFPKEHSKYNFQINGKSVYNYINKVAAYHNEVQEGIRQKQQLELKTQQQKFLAKQKVLLNENHVGRQKALERTSKHDVQFFSKYDLNSQTKSFLSTCGIDQSSFAECHGNQLQHQLHCEFLETTNNVADLYHQTQSVDLKTFCKGIAKTAETGCNANHLNQTKTAGYIADFCHHAIAFGRGVVASCGDNIHAIGQALLHPFDTVQELATLAGQATLSLAKAIVASDIVNEYEAMALYGDIDPNNSTMYRNSVEHLEGIQDSIDGFIESVQGQSNEQNCENLGYIISDAVFNFYVLPKGTKFAGANLSKAIEHGKQYISTFGEIGKESAKIAGLAGFEGFYRVEEAMSLMNKEGQALKPHKPFQQVEKTVATSAKTAKTTVRITQAELAAIKPPKVKSKIISELINAFGKNEEHMFHLKHKLQEILGECHQKAYNKLVGIVEKVEVSGLLKEGDNQILIHIGDYKVEMRLNIHDGSPRKFNAFEKEKDRIMHHRIIIEGK
jgi:hypothetical protein